MQRHDKGFLVALGGVVLTLLWIGVFKFTPTEAAAIRPLVASHPLMNWLYSLLSEQGVSNLIGYWSSWGAVVTFVATLSFLLTVPGVWKLVDGVPVTEFFILKDLVLLGVVWHYLNMSRAQLVSNNSNAFGTLIGCLFSSCHGDRRNDAHEHAKGALKSLHINVCNELRTYLRIGTAHNRNTKDCAILINPLCGKPLEGKPRAREIAQLRRSAQNEMQRCEKQLGGCEGRKVGAIGSCLPIGFLVTLVT